MNASIKLRNLHLTSCHESQMREDYYAGLEDRYFLTFEQAKKQKFVIDFDDAPPASSPNKLGITVVDDVKLEDVVPYIDWVSSTIVIHK